MNIFVYILGRIPPKVLLAQQSEIQYSRLAGHGVTLCRWFVLSTLCVKSVLCVSYERSSIGLNYINIAKRPVEQLEGWLGYYKTVYTTRSDLESLDLVYIF